MKKSWLYEAGWAAIAVVVVSFVRHWTESTAPTITKDLGRK